jgi:hypothetical protein
MPTPLLAQLAQVRDALRAVPVDVAGVRELSDDEVLEYARLSAELEAASTTQVTLSAGELARRSAPELGHDGLAQKGGFRTPEALVRATTGATGRDAVTAVRVGRVLVDSDLPADPITGELLPAAEPWLRAVAAGLVEGSVSVAAADAIRAGLGTPDASLAASALAEAAAVLCAEAATLDADALLRRARQLRDEIDTAGVAEREAAQRDRRSLRFTRLPDGMSVLNWRLDPETAAQVGDLYDRATSPRRGGPRFVDSAQAGVAAAIADDARSTEQLASDAFLELLRAGADADSSALLGTGAPVVRVLITERDLRAQNGIGWIEGQPGAISAATARRLACGGRIELATLDNGAMPLNIGRAQRHFTLKQRIALAVIFGGCAWPGCDREPSWCEGHHIDHWQRDHGPTDLANGILLCKHHHLLLHDHGWEIHRQNDDHLLIPPTSVDPTRTPRLMQKRDLARRRLLAHPELAHTQLADSNAT